MEAAVGVMIAIGLSAACGFRVFLPPLVVGILHATGHLELAESFQWLSSPVALVALGTAAGLEVVAYFVPVVDNLLDTIATPTAVVAGTLVSASVITDLSPLVQWSTAAVLGVGVTAPVQVATAATRGAMTVSSAGIGNPILSVVETAGSGALAALGVFAPLVGVGIVLAVVATSVFILRAGLRRFNAAGHRDRVPVSPPPGPGSP